jgi:hypothetical protein
VHVQIAVETDALTSCSTGAARAAETFAGMSQLVRTSSSTAAVAAGTAHARTGLSDFGEHWSAVLRALSAGTEATSGQLQTAAITYRAVDTEVSRAAQTH